MSQNRTPHHRLAAELRSLLCENGITLSRDVLDYLASALDITDPDELHRFVDMEADSDLASLLELIFFPDQELKIRLEPLLQELNLGKDDESVVLDCLLKDPLQLHVYFPESSKAIPLALPRDPARTFIQRLRIDRSPPRELLQAIDQAFTRQESLRIQVLLRSARFPFTRENQDFLLNILTHLPPPAEGFQATLRYALAFLDELKGASDIANQLIQKKIFLEQTLDKAQALNRRLRSQPMEVLLMQRESILSFNTEELRSHLRIVDQLCAAVMGFVPETDCESPSYSFTELSGTNLGQWK